MFTVSDSLLVNPPGEVPLDRAQLWEGLVRKAQDPIRFVPAISECRVLERGPDWFVREVVLRGERVRELVTYYPGEGRVFFQRLPGCSAQGTVENLIEEGPLGELRLRFTFHLTVAGLAPGSAEERRFAEEMRGSYLAAVGATLSETRRLTLVGAID